MNLISLFVIAILTNSGWSIQPKDNFLKKDDPTQVAKLICSDQVERYHSDRYRELNRVYSQHPTEENNSAIYYYAQGRREFTKLREEYLADLLTLKGSRFGVWDNRFKRDVRAGWFTRNLAHEGFRRAIRNRSFADGAAKTVSSLIPGVSWGETRDVDSKSIFLTNLVGSDEFIRELDRCQKHYGVEVPNLYDEIAEAAEVSDLIGLRVGKIGAELLSIVGGIKVGSAIARGGASVFPATAEKLSRIPKWAGWTAGAAGLAAVIFPPVSKKVRESKSFSKFENNADITDVVPIADRDNWLGLREQILDLRDLVFDYQNHEAGEEKDNLIKKIACFIRKDIRTQNPPLEVMESLLVFYGRYESPNLEQVEDINILRFGVATIQKVNDLGEEYFVNCPDNEIQNEEEIQTLNKMKR